MLFMYKLCWWARICLIIFWGQSVTADSRLPWVEVSHLVNLSWSNVQHFQLTLPATLFKNSNHDVKSRLRNLKRIDCQQQSEEKHISVMGE